MVGFHALAQRARDPHAAGAVVGLSALVAYATLIDTLARSVWGITPGATAFLWVLVGLGGLNAYAVTWFVWRRYVSEWRQLHRGWALVVGFMIGVISLYTYLALGILLEEVLTAILGSTAWAAPNVPEALLVPYGYMIFHLFAMAFGEFGPAWLPVAAATVAVFALAQLERAYR